jgi:C4-dicarboxylate-specific signal transduction histidine kinase
LEQVAINLITNALQSLPDADHGIRVSTAMDETGDQLLLRIEDEGGGIPEDIAARVMEPFFTTRLDRGGTGLGLAICVTIINDHGGSIRFESEPGKGTVFIVRLQRADTGDGNRSAIGGNDAGR